MKSTKHASNFRRILKEHGQIAIIWSIDDVKEVQPDLTDEQAFEVLEFIEQEHDCDLGLSWSTIECSAEELFPGDD